MMCWSIALSPALQNNMADHPHSRHSHHLHTPETGNIKVAFFLNFGFTIIEIIGGILTGSLAILTDALHDLGDSISLGMSWYFQKLAAKESDRKFTYGYGRFSLLGAILNALILFAGSIFLLTEAIPRLWNPTDPDTIGMFLLAILGVIINGAAVIRLRKGTSMNERVVAFHLLEDVLGWVAILIGSVVIHFTGWTIIDPILSIAISLFILFNVYRNLRESFKIILQATPSQVSVEKIESELNSIDGIEGSHDIHIWTIDGEYHIMSTHVVISNDLSETRISDLKKEIRNHMLNFGIHHVTIEIETPDEDCEEA